MYKIGICGHYGNGNVCLDGQTIKTKTLTNTLIGEFGLKEIRIVDTYRGKTRFLIILFKLLILIKNCQNVIILPAHNSVRIFSPFLALLNLVYNRRLIYVVIGGWLPKLVFNHAILQKSLKKFDSIFVETETAKKLLENQGFRNINILPNCKSLSIQKAEDLIYINTYPLKLCTFSRIIPEKGIEDAIKTIIAINNNCKKCIYSLDIYGQIDDNYKERFLELLQKSPKYINYKGTVDYSQSTKVIKEYYALIFPTKFYTEGIPGTIIDSYAAGVPVIATKWESFKDVIDEGITGIGVNFGDIEDLYNTLLKIANNPQRMNKMKLNCLEKAKNFESGKMIEILVGGGYLTKD